MGDSASRGEDANELRLTGVAEPNILDLKRTLSAPRSRFGEGDTARQKPWRVFFEIDSHSECMPAP